MEFKRRIIVTGGAGFIGSHVVRRLVNRYPSYRIINLDVLTYAGNLENLKDVEQKENYVFEKVDICDADAVSATLNKYEVDGIIHLAAESHVDRSIMDPLAFIHTNIVGLLTCFNARGAIGMAIGMENYSTMYPQMRCMDLLGMKVSLLKRHLTTLKALIRPLRQVQIIL